MDFLAGIIIFTGCSIFIGLLFGIIDQPQRPRLPRLRLPRLPRRTRTFKNTTPTRLTRTRSSLNRVPRVPPSLIKAIQEYRFHGTSLTNAESIFYEKKCRANKNCHPNGLWLGSFQTAVSYTDSNNPGIVHFDTSLIDPSRVIASTDKIFSNNGGDMSAFARGEGYYFIWFKGHALVYLIPGSDDQYYQFEFIIPVGITDRQGNQIA